MPADVPDVVVAVVVVVTILALAIVVRRGAGDPIVRVVVRVLGVLLTLLFGPRLGSSFRAKLVSVNASETPLPN
jgi:hypothetical protein